MIAISPQHLAELERSSRHWHMHRHDIWLKTSLQGWQGHPDPVRVQTLSAAFQIATESRLVQDDDVRLLCWLYAALDTRAEAWFARPDIREVMAWKTTNRGAILYELYLRAGADIRSVLGLL